jgi:hypothetical protein
VLLPSSLAKPKEPTIGRSIGSEQRRELGKILKLFLLSTFHRSLLLPLMPIELFLTVLSHVGVVTVKARVEIWLGVANIIFSVESASNKVSII